MGYQRSGKEVDVEADLHGLTAEQMQHTLEKHWSKWRGLRLVRVIHGQGEVLRPALQRWCAERGIPCAPDTYNPGSSLLSPRERILPAAPAIGNTLADAGLRLTLEEQAYLRDPEALRRAQEEARKRQAAEAARKQQDSVRQSAIQRHNDALWQNEMARLDRVDRSKDKAKDGKMTPPRIVPKSEMRHQEGYWRAELVRVADTDTDTLTVQKRTGLDELAPPMPPKPEATPDPPARPQRNTAADQALFEAELERLSGSEPD